jgi:hypothetical protein
VISKTARECDACCPMDSYAKSKYVV